MIEINCSGDQGVQGKNPTFLHISEREMKSILQSREQSPITKASEREDMKTLDVDSVKIKDPHVISDAFCSFFTSIVTTLKEKAFPLCNFSWKMPSKMPKKTDQNFIFNVVSRHEVEKQLKSVKRNKATGLDDLPPGLIKDSAELISAPLAHLINLSLKTSIFPTD